MEKKVYSTNCEELHTISLNPRVFEVEVKAGSIYQLVNTELANKRQGTASSKSRGEVRGSTAKPWRQKGTGRARAGHKRSPIWRTGGVIFGPKPRDFSKKIPKKMKQLAYRSILSMRAQNDEIFKIIEDFTIESAKTRDLFAIISKFQEKSKEKTVLVLKDDDYTVKRAGRNIPNLIILSYNRLRAHDLFYAKKMIFMESSIKSLNEFLASGEDV